MGWRHSIIMMSKAGIPSAIGKISCDSTTGRGLTVKSANGLADRADERLSSKLYSFQEFA
jgi:hypothetical protein